MNKPAFPLNHFGRDGEVVHTDFGISDREYFAAKVLVGMWANSDFYNWGYEEMAKAAVAQADALIAASEES